MQNEQRRPNSFMVRETGDTYENYAVLPDEMGRFELLDGELWAMSPAPAITHQMVSKELEKALTACEQDYFVFHAPVDIILSAYSVLQPDILLLHKSKSHQLSNRGVEGPPDLVVEILSPSSAWRDRGKKMNLYAHYGVSEYWIVDSKNEWLEQYFLEQSRFTLHSVYKEADVVVSPHAYCVSFTMADIMADIPDLR